MPGRRDPHLHPAGRISRYKNHVGSTGRVSAGARMDDTPIPEWRAEGLVTVGDKSPGGGHYVILRGPGDPPVYLGLYLNPDVAKRGAALVGRFVGAALPEAPHGSASRGW